LTDQDKLSDTQRFTGAYTTSGTPAYGNLEGQLRPTGQETTFVSATTGATATFRPGDIIDGSYQLRKLIGRGGMGIVFACRHETLNKQYALKILSDERLSPESWARFQAEAKVLARLNHPGIVGIHNMGIHDKHYPYYVMDLLSDETLDLLIDRHGPLPASQALDFFIQICDALSSAHLQGIIHRDVKPSNLMLLRDHQSRISAIKVVDFGIARLSQQSSDSQSQTATGIVFGTPYYMSPEQCQGLRADQRSDIYSLGCALFETLTGRPPFRGKSALETFMLHQTEPPPSLAGVAPQAEFPQALELAVEKMLSKRPSDRYQTMLQVQHDLERIRAGKPIKAEGLTGATTFQLQPGPFEPGAMDSGMAGQSSDINGHEIGAQEARKNQSVLPKSVVISVVSFVIFFPIVVLSWIIKTPTHMPLERAADENFDYTIDQSKEAPAANKAAESPGKNAAEMPVKSSRVTLASPLDDEEAVKTVLYDYVQNMGQAQWDEAGYSDKEVEDTRSFNFPKVMSGDVAILRKKLIDYIANGKHTGARLTRQGSPCGFHFPSDFSLGGIKIGNSNPLFATGFVPAQKGSDVCLYLENSTGHSPEFLDLFGPDEITAVYVPWHKPEEAIQRISKWKRLKEFSFFNPLLKCPPGCELHEESSITDSDLPVLNQLKGLRSLGLCGRYIHSEAILAIAALPKLESLKLKSVNNIETILPDLCKRNNLRELWLYNEKTDNSQLKTLAGMKNLDRLRIRRSALKPDSAQYFAKLTALRALSLDCNWSAAEKAKFCAALPACHVDFEPTADLHFWYVLPPEASNAASGKR
jgi:serine/threonine protein kinase